MNIGTKGKRVRRDPMAGRRAALWLAAALLLTGAGCAGGQRMGASAAQMAEEPRAADAVAVQVIRADYICAAAEGPGEPEPDGAFLVRSDLPLDAELQAVLWEACRECGVMYSLALGVMDVESDFQVDAVSAAGCYGLMQLNPKYFPSGLSPEENIRYGVEFLAEKIDQYGGDLEAALTAYYAGHDTGDREYSTKVLRAAEGWFCHDED